MGRHKNADWVLPTDRLNPNQIASWQYVPIAVLMDIRDELQRLNALLHCPNFTGIPHKLDDIRKNTRKPKRRRKGRR